MDFDVFLIKFVLQSQCQLVKIVSLMTKRIKLINQSIFIQSLLYYIKCSDFIVIYSTPKGDDGSIKEKPTEYVNM